MLFVRYHSDVQGLPLFAQLRILIMTVSLQTGHWGSITLKICSFLSLFTASQL
jgi:hypothetical protein